MHRVLHSAPNSSGGAPKMTRLTRGLILNLLRLVYPEERLDVTLRQEIGRAGGDVQDGIWEAHVAYLEESGYLVMVDLPVGPVAVTGYKLTPKGVNLMDGDIAADPGIQIHRES